MAQRASFRLDSFLTAILVTAVTASFLPIPETYSTAMDGVTRIAIFGLFFLYGVRLEPNDARAGLRHWRLHVTILLFTFGAFPVVGLGLAALPSNLIPAALIPGLLYLTLCPSTVQSSVNVTSLAKGNVAGAIVAATTSNLLGVVLTPALAATLLSTTIAGAVRLDTLTTILAQILLPFVLGQLSRRWTAAFVTRHPRLRLLDQLSILLMVYGAFSDGAREGIWAQVTGATLLVLVGICAALVSVMLGLTWIVGGWLGFDRGDRIAIQFCGTQKSLATGLPMATVLFAGEPVGLIVLPLMIFHQAQLLATTTVATHHARRIPG
ncbi:MAG: bile acid:sodium symporter family protein [Propioniciclava sp.]